MIALRPATDKKDTKNDQAALNITHDHIEKRKMEQTMNTKIYHGDIAYAPSADTLAVHEDSYIVVEEGKVAGIYKEVPECYRGVEVIDYGRKLIIPAFSDLHVHGAQYVQRGIGMDCLLSDWLNNYTFPQESHFADMDYAKKCYDAFVDDMIRHGTFHANVFATIHREATDYLFERMEAKGMYGFVGKVNMDMNSPEYLSETTKDSLRETEIYLATHSGSKKVRPILAPRFAPTCTEALMQGLGKLAAKYQCGVHTHLVESKWEAQEALRVFPGYGSDAEIYERAGMLDHGPSIFAHVIFPTAEDKRILKAHNSICVHCPDATVNVIAGIMPLASMHDEGLKIALGSDVAAGHGVAVYRQAARAVQLSKLKEFYEPDESRTITITQAFYHATKEAGSVFGKVGSFEKGYSFDALVIDSMEDPWMTMSVEERLERFCYTGDDRNIRARFIDGRMLGIDFKEG